MIGNRKQNIVKGRQKAESRRQKAKNRQRSFSAFCFLLSAFYLLFPVFADAQNSVKLEYKIKPGVISKYLIMTDMTATVSGTKLGMRSTMPFKQEVKSVDQQGLMEILITTEDMSIETDQNWQAIFGAGPVLAEGELKKLQIVMKMAKNGKISDFQVVGGKRMEPGVRETFSRIAPTFPSRPLKVGDTWKAELAAVPKEFAMGSDAAQQKSEVIYKFVGFEKYKNHNCAKITMTSDVDAKGSISPTGIPIPMTFKGKSIGTLLFAHQLGLIVKQDLQIDLTVSINMPDMPPMQFLSKSVMRTELQN